MVGPTRRLIFLFIASYCKKISQRTDYSWLSSYLSIRNRRLAFTSLPRSLSDVCHEKGNP